MATTNDMVRVADGLVWAEDNGGDGPPLVLLHPGIGDSTVWDPVLPALSGRFRVIRYDVRGYGRSPVPSAPFSLAADLGAVLDHFGVHRASMVGCSMGGATAMSFAVTHAERVASLVLLCPGVPGYPWPDEPELEAAYEAVTSTGDQDALVALWLSVWAAAGVDETVSAQMRSAARAWPTEEFEQEDETVFARLGEIKAPSVVLVGDLDRAALVAANQEVARRIPGCRLRTLPGVDHYLPLRVPELVVETVLTYCAEE